MSKLTEQELSAAMQRRKEARASDACEGIVLTDEEERLFDYMEEQRLSHEDCRKLISDYIDGKLSPP